MALRISRRRLSLTLDAQSIFGRQNEGLQLAPSLVSAVSVGGFLVRSTTWRSSALPSRTQSTIAEPSGAMVPLWMVRVPPASTSFVADFLAAEYP